MLLSQADARHIPLPDQSVQCVITSPPFWGLRDYGISGQIGLEASPEAYVAEMVSVFREIWRVLRNDGTVWLNLGDSYAASPKGSLKGQDKSNLTSTQTQQHSPCGIDKLKSSGLKAKDLVGIPWRVAFALQSDGWWLRSDIIWAKGVSFCPTYSGSVMPESVRDRPTQSYEHVFLLAKSRRYYYDATAVREPLACPDAADGSRVFGGKNKHGANAVQQRTTGGTYDTAPAGRNLRSVWTIPDDEWAEFLQFREWKRAQADLRDTWTINPKPSRLAHYAAFPPALVEPMVLAGTSAKGCCPECGAGWVRVVKRTGKMIQQHWAPGTQGKIDVAQGKHGKTSVMNTGHTAEKETTGWCPACDCGVELEPRPCIVLDCFGGTMTVGEVCAKHGRHFVGLDLKAEYVEMGRERCAEVQIAMPF